MNSSSFNIYDASAGSGKTYTLVKEYLKILYKSPFNDAYKNILAITFTNKAVGEMKERIIEALKEFSSKAIIENSNSMFLEICEEIEISPKELVEKSKIILEHIIHNYAAFDISTIDKFTQRVIRTFAYDLHLPINFEVELDTDMLLAKAVDNLIARAGTDDELTKTLIAFAIEKADDDKSWDIAYDFNPIAKLLVNENHLPFVELLKDKTLNDFKCLKTYLKEKAKEESKTIQKESQRVLDLITESGLEHSDFSRSSLPNYFVKLLNKEYKVSFDLKWQIDLIEGKSLYPGRVTQDVSFVIDSIQPEITAAFNKTKQLTINYMFLQNFYNNVTPLSVLNEINKEVAKIKQDKNILLISEFNSVISNHIKEQPAPFIYERLGEKFRHYFIDEFQDTSVMQWENLVPLLGNSLASENGSAMLVGDAKQAIYRWRGGKAEQFIGLYNGNNPFKLGSSIRRLPVNYRSYKEIIKFNNAFFKHLSSFVFSEDTYAKLYLNSFQGFSEINEGFVSINFIELTREDDRDLEYPKEVLKSINNSLQNGYKLKDICVLVRKKKEGVSIANYLTDFGIDIISSETLLVNNSQEVKFIINLLKFILEPNNLQVKIEVISFIANYKLQINNHHLFYKELIALDINSFFLKCNNLGFNFNYSEVLQVSTYEAIETVIYGFNLVDYSNAYIQFFLDFALDYENKKNSNLVDFITSFDAKKEALSIVSPEGQNAVKIMTIHKSKGLEFPIVIFPYADLDIYKENSPKIWFPLNPDTYQGFEVAYLNYNQNIEAINDVGHKLYLQHQSELELDNINLLYVALTRSIEQLHIISSKKLLNTGEENSKTYSGLFISYLKHIKKWDENNSYYHFGQQKKLSVSKKDSVIIHKQKHFISTPKKNHGINIITNSGYLWDTSQKDAIERGNLIHDLMSQIKTKEDINSTISNFVSEAIINITQANELKIIIKNIVNHPLLEYLYSPNTIIYNENDIITKQGEILRPDRVVINKLNEAIIVDYKTGMPNNNHIKQLEKYSDALRDMSFKVKKRLLIYANDPIEIKEV